MTKKRVYTKTQERLDTTDAAARDIVAREKLASELKTARLREARLKKEADNIELPAAESKRKHRTKGL